MSWLVCLLLGHDWSRWSVAFEAGDPVCLATPRRHCLRCGKLS